MCEKESVGVVNDQFGSPTYAGDLAEAVMKIIISNNPVEGIYHYCNNGIISWYDFAKEIKRLINSKCALQPIATASYPTPAKRPAYSSLNTDKIIQTYCIQIPTWNLVETARPYLCGQTGCVGNRAIKVVRQNMIAHRLCVAEEFPRRLPILVSMADHHRKHGAQHLHPSSRIEPGHQKAA